METKRKTAGEESRRQNSMQYFLPSAGKSVRVCRQCFLDTLNVGTMFVRCALKEKTFSAPHKLTGRSPANKIPAVDRLHVKNFIKCFPTMPSHYCRKDSKLMYLEPGLSLSRMYGLYKAEVDHQKRRCVGRKVFDAVFHELDLAFYNPRKDQCDICLQFKEGKVDQLHYEEHLAEKERARVCKELDKQFAIKNVDTTRVVTVDLQQLLQCPKSFSSAVYYKRKLSVHNFTIYDLASKDGQCYLWHEGNGGLDSDEFASMVVDYLKHVPDTVTCVTLWSDGCTYQNRNSTVSSAILYFLRSGEKTNLKEVHQKYLTKGHTQMEADSMHASIETNSSKIEVFTPSEWESVIKTARRNSPYRVSQLQYTFWQKFPNLVFSIRPGKVSGDPTVTDICHLMYTKDGLFYSLSHGTPLRPLCAQRVGRHATKAEASIPIQKYTHKLPITKAKVEDLKSLCETVIPKVHGDF